MYFFAKCIFSKCSPMNGKEGGSKRKGSTTDARIVEIMLEFSEAEFTVCFWQHEWFCPKKQFLRLPIKMLFSHAALMKQVNYEKMKDNKRGVQCTNKVHCVDEILSSKCTTMYTCSILWSQCDHHRYMFCFFICTLFISFFCGSMYLLWTNLFDKTIFGWI